MQSNGRGCAELNVVVESKISVIITLEHKPQGNKKGNIQ